MIPSNVPQLRNDYAPKTEGQQGGFSLGTGEADASAFFKNSSKFLDNLAKLQPGDKITVSVKTEGQCKYPTCEKKQESYFAALNPYGEKDSKTVGLMCSYLDKLKEALMLDHSGDTSIPMYGAIDIYKKLDAAFQGINKFIETLEKNGDGSVTPELLAALKTKQNEVHQEAILGSQYHVGEKFHPHMQNIADAVNSIEGGVPLYLAEAAVRNNTAEARADIKNLKGLEEKLKNKNSELEDTKKLHAQAFKEKGDAEIILGRETEIKEKTPQDIAYLKQEIEDYKKWSSAPGEKASNRAFDSRSEFEQYKQNKDAGYKDMDQPNLKLKITDEYEPKENLKTVSYQERIDIAKTKLAAAEDLLSKADNIEAIYKNADAKFNELSNKIGALKGEIEATTKELQVAKDSIMGKNLQTSEIKTQIQKEMKEIDDFAADFDASHLNFGSKWPTFPDDKSYKEYRANAPIYDATAFSKISKQNNISNIAANLESLGELKIGQKLIYNDSGVMTVDISMFRQLPGKTETKELTNIENLYVFSKSLSELELKSLTYKDLLTLASKFEAAKDGLNELATTYTKEGKKDNYAIVNHLGTTLQNLEAKIYAEIQNRQGENIGNVWADLKNDANTLAIGKNEQQIYKEMLPLVAKYALFQEGDKRISSTDQIAIDPPEASKPFMDVLKILSTKDFSPEAKEALLAAIVAKGVKMSEADFKSFLEDLGKHLKSSETVFVDNYVKQKLDFIASAFEKPVVPIAEKPPSGAQIVAQNALWLFGAMYENAPPVRSWTATALQAAAKGIGPANP